MCIRDSSESHDGDENVDELHDHILGDHGSPLPVAGVPGAGLEPARLSAGDFKSPVSTSFTTRANWRRESESNRRPRLCRPLHDHSAIPPESKEGRSCNLPSEIGAGNESRTRDLNLGKVALYQLSYSREIAGDFTENPERREAPCGGSRASTPRSAPPRC